MPIPFSFWFWVFQLPQESERYEPDIGTLLSAPVLSEGTVLQDPKAVACDSEDVYCFLMLLSREGGSLLGLHMGKGGSQLWRWVLVVGRVLPLLFVSSAGTG